MGRLFRYRWIVVLIGLACNFGEANAQFYDGTKQTFGKNRPRYNQFFWTYHRTPLFDVYYYQGNEELASFITNFAQGEIERLESLFRTRLDERVIFIIFNRLSDMQQSNIGLVTGKEEHNLGGTSQIFNNKVTLYFESNYSQFENQVTTAISNLLIRQLVLGGSNKSFWEPNAQSSYPLWFIEGLKAYIAKGWSVKSDEALLAITQRTRITRLQELNDNDAILAGQSFWFYFSQTYGLNSITECISYTGFYDNHIKAFRTLTRKSFSDILSEFESFWSLRLTSFHNDSTAVATIKPITTFPLSKSVTQLGLSPNGNSIAWVENISGKKRLWVKNVTTGKRDKIYSTGNKLKQIQDNTFPVFCWHPNSKAIIFATEVKGEVILHIVDLVNQQHANRKFPNISKILSLNYSPDALEIVMSAVVAGKPDVFHYSIVENRLERVTQSVADAVSPVFFRANSKIAFISNDFDETNLELLDQQKKLLFDRSGDAVWLAHKNESDYDYTQISHRKYENLEELSWADHNNFIFTSDATGQTNLFKGSLDSTIIRIDTIIHYGYSIKSLEAKLSNSNFITSNYIPAINQMAVYAPTKRRNALFIEQPEFTEGSQKPTFWRKELEKGWKIVENDAAILLPSADSLYASNLMVQKSPENNAHVDVFSWVFEREKLRFHLNNQGFSLPDKNQQTDRISKIGYNLTFFPNKIVNQVDFSFLNANYQPYTGSPSFFNPGLNLNFVLGAADLFEDYKLYGGLSFGSDLESNEFLIMFEYLGSIYKHQIAFHRQAYKNFDFEEETRVHSNEIIYIARYPFSQVASIGGGLTCRYDNIIVPAVDFETLGAMDDQRFWTGLKSDFTIDNSNRLGFNLMEGVRLKFFIEAQTGVGMGKRADLYTLGTDIRGYLSIWRGSIVAGRFAAGTSMGHAGLVYYLGSLDGWVNFNPTVPNFDQSVAVNNREKLMFQALATNLRGFSQNIRNGPSFAVINTELRIPIIRLISNRSVGSKSLNSLQLIGFFDAGSAWKGPSPWHRQNAWEEESISNGPVTVTFKTQRSPLVAGFGGGIRFQTLGYPLRFDYAWGIESGEIKNPIFYFSTSIDF